MSIKLWDGRGPVLADTSAWVAVSRIPPAREFLSAAVERGEIAWCWPVRYELMVDARGSEGIAAVDRTLEGLREIAVDRGVRRGVLAEIRELASAGPHGAHRFPLTDLTVAAAAQSAGLGVLHFDHHFDDLGEQLDIETIWIADPSA